MCDSVLHHIDIDVALVTELVILLKRGAELHIGMGLLPDLTEMLAIIVKDRFPSGKDIHGYRIECNVSAAREDYRIKRPPRPQVLLIQGLGHRLPSFFLPGDIVLEVRGLHVVHNEVITRLEASDKSAVLEH